jgi:hypothetical protein
MVGILQVWGQREVPEQGEHQCAGHGSGETHEKTPFGIHLHKSGMRAGVLGCKQGHQNRYDDATHRANYGSKQKDLPKRKSSFPKWLVH